MARLIDAEKTKACIQNVVEHLLEAGNPEMAGSLQFATEIVDAQPTIDTVKRGKWSRPMEGKARLFQCNLCGGLTYTHGLATRKPYDFCPNCGARMDGE